MTSPERAPRPWFRHPVLAAALAVLLLGAGSLAWRFLRNWDRFLESRIRPLAEAEVARLSDSTFLLSMGRLQVDLRPGRIAIDSFHITTDTARNAARTRPLADVTIGVFDCQLTGINVLKLVRRRGLSADEFSCARIEVSARLPELRRQRVAMEAARRAATAAASPPRTAAGRAARAAAVTAATTAARNAAGPRLNGFLAPERAVNLPAAVPKVEIDRIRLPQVSVDLTRRENPGARVRVGRLYADVRGTRIVSGEPAGARTLFSDHVEVGGQGLKLQVGDRDDDAIELGSLTLDLTGAAARIQGLRVGPSIPDVEWLRRQRVRKDRIRVSLDSARLTGFDYAAFAGPEGDVAVEHVEVHGFDLDVRTHLELPPVARRNLSPQALVRGRHRDIAIDSVTVHNSVIRYHEHAKGKPTTGLASFDNVRARITNFRTVARDGGEVPPLSIDATADLFGAGKLHALITVPLTAPDFEMRYRGTLGPMDFTALNTFIERNMPARIKSGHVRGVTFDAVARNGHALGAVTPLYDDLQIELQDPKAGGIERLGLDVLSAAANALKVRKNNPDKEGKEPRVGKIDHRFVPSESLVQYLWFALRDALVPVLSH